MHIKSGDKLMLAAIFQDFDGNAHEPSSYSVALWQTNNDTGATVEVTPSLVAGAESKVDGYHLYEYTAPSGDYTYLWYYTTTDTDVLAQGIPEMHYSGGWVDDVAQTGADSDTLETLSDQLDAIKTKVDSFSDSGSIVSSSSISSSNALTLTRGDRISQNINGISDAVLTASKIWVTCKYDKDDLDSAAIFQIEKTGGLLYLNGTAVTSDPTTKAGISTADNGDGTATVTFTLEAGQSAELPAVGCYWDIQYKTASDTDTPKQGTCTIDGDVTRATA